MSATSLLFSCVLHLFNDYDDNNNYRLFLMQRTQKQAETQNTYYVEIRKKQRKQMNRQTDRQNVLTILGKSPLFLAGTCFDEKSWLDFFLNCITPLFTPPLSWLWRTWLKQLSIETFEVRLVLSLFCCDPTGPLFSGKSQK
jgi:hypothetical protein